MLKRVLTKFNAKIEVSDFETLGAPQRSLLRTTTPTTATDHCSLSEATEEQQQQAGNEPASSLEKQCRMGLIPPALPYTLTTSGVLRDSL